MALCVYSIVQWSYRVLSERKLIFDMGEMVWMLYEMHAFCADCITPWFPADVVPRMSVSSVAGNSTSTVRVQCLRENVELAAQPATSRGDDPPRSLPVPLSNLQQGPAPGARPPRTSRQPARLEEGLPVFDLRPRVWLQTQPEASCHVASWKNIVGWIDASNWVLIVVICC